MAYSSEIDQRAAVIRSHGWCHGPLSHAHLHAVRRHANAQRSADLQKRKEHECPHESRERGCAVIKEMVCCFPRASNAGAGNSTPSELA